MSGSGIRSQFSVGTDVQLPVPRWKRISRLKFWFGQKGMEKAVSVGIVGACENPPPREKEWMVNYVVNDRKLLIAWDGDRSTLKFPTEIGAGLNFLS